MSGPCFKSWIYYAATPVGGRDLEIIAANSPDQIRVHRGTSRSRVGDDVRAELAVGKSKPSGNVGMTIRSAGNEADLKVVVEMACQSLREGLLKRLPLDKDRMLRTVRDHLSKPERRLMLLAERQGQDGRGRADGLLIGAVDRLQFSPARMGTITLLFVRPEVRGGWTAMRLLKEFRVWAQDRGAVACTLHVTSGVSYNRTHRFLDKAGWRLVGGNYVI